MSRCMKIVDGRRCKRRSTWGLPISYQWDPIKGTGVEGPDLRLCTQHGDATLDMAPGKRIRVVGGWYGRIWNAEAKAWTVLACVFRHPTKHLAARAWHRFRRPCRSGEIRPRVNYDEALAATRK